MDKDTKENIVGEVEEGVEISELEAEDRDLNINEQRYTKKDMLIAAVCPVLLLLFIWFLTIPFRPVPVCTTQDMLDCIKEVDFSTYEYNLLENAIDCGCLDDTEIKVSAWDSDRSIWTLTAVTGTVRVDEEEIPDIFTAKFQYYKTKRSWAMTSWEWDRHCTCGCNGRCVMEEDLI